MTAGRSTANRATGTGQAGGPGESAPSLKRGTEVIAAMVRQLPNAPGVYRMINDAGDVLYVGKARSLKKRVQNYARLNGQSHRIARMITQTASMEFVRTHTETEALLLEANLIKRLRPRFNVLLRDDKSFPYILVSRDHRAPQILKHRGARKRRGDYYGPFASAGAVNRTLNALQKAFLLRSCSDAMFESRTRPCLLFQIKRCAAPCTGEISQQGYDALVEEAHAFLSGRSKAIQDTLSHAMHAASERMDFETAAVYRDRLSALSHIQSHQGINPHSIDQADVFACHQEGGHTCIQVFFFRTGQNWGNRAYFPRADRSLGAAEVLESFLAQFYDDKPCPALVLLSHDIAERQLLEQALGERSGHRVAVTVPKRGEKRDLVDHALGNAREALGRKLAETSSQQTLLAGLAEMLGLPAVPRRIEVYDNSHMMGSNAVGAMIVTGPEGLVKNQYRKFTIKDQSLTPGDDYGMMREVLQRRFSRLLKEAGPRSEAARDETGFGPWPDLVLIDGGLGQLNAARAILKDLGIDDVPLVGVAKGVDRDAGREVIHIAGRTPFRLPLRDPVLYFIQRLRDEAHRFAIGTHRARRKAEIGRNPLDDIPGIGPTRKRALLHHFGSAKAVSRAAVSDLTAVAGVSAQSAQAIYDFFHDKAD